MAEITLIEYQEVCRVAWLKLVNETHPGLRDALDELAFQVFRRGFAEGVQRGVEWTRRKRTDDEDQSR